MAIEVHPMNLGEGMADMSFAAWGLRQGETLWMPCSAYLILGAGGPIVVDAGIRSAEELTAASGIPFRQSKDQTLEANLRRHGIEAGDIETVVFTHLHNDHTGVCDQFPNARLVMQREELRYAAAPTFPFVFYDRIDIAKLINPLWPQLELVQGDVEIAPGVRTVVTGGHAPYHQMVYVDLDSGQAVITGDVMYIAELAIAERRPPGYVVNMEDAISGLQRAIADADHLLPMHDAAVYEKYPEGLS